MPWQKYTLASVHFLKYGREGPLSLSTTSPIHYHSSAAMVNIVVLKSPCPNQQTRNTKPTEDSAQQQFRVGEENLVSGDLFKQGT